jgi:hypothetical protein
MLMELAHSKSPHYVIEVVTGQYDYDKSVRGDEVDRVKEYYRICLQKENLKEVGLDELLAVLKPTCPIEYLSTR